MRLVKSQCWTRSDSALLEGAELVSRIPAGDLGAFMMHSVRRGRDARALCRLGCALGPAWFHCCGACSRCVPLTLKAENLIQMAACDPSPLRVLRGGVVFNSPFHAIKESKCELLSHVQLLATPWTIARQAPLSMAFSRQYWNGLPFPSPGDLPSPGIKVASLASSVLAGRLFTTSAASESAGSRFP